MIYQELNNLCGQHGQDTETVISILQECNDIFEFRDWVMEDRSLYIPLMSRELTIEALSMMYYIDANFSTWFPNNA